MCEDKYLETLKNIIKIQFNDKRRIIGIANAENGKISDGEFYADILETDNNELIAVVFQEKDFGKSELEEYKKYGEELYQKSRKLVSIYIICSPHIKNRLRAESFRFNGTVLIELTKIEYSDSYDIFRYLTELVKNNVKFDEEDLFVLSMIPKMVPPEDLRYMRIKCLKLWKEINKKGLIK